jgi:DNA-binding NtrC family response regulator
MSTILVVDDESAIREIYARSLVSSGYRTVDARTAEEALDFLALNSDIDVVIADLDMPGNGGAWLVEQMRERFPNVAVVLATANDAVPGTLTLQAAVVSYLVKPISGDRLRAAVSDALAPQQRQSPSTGSGPDPIEGWLDKKLTRNDTDGDDRNR